MIQFSEGGSTTVRAGWIRAFNHLGHQAAFWKPQLKSIHDAWSEFRPDLFIGTTYDLDDAVEKCIRAHPQTRVALFASAWGDMADALPEAEFPIVRVTEQEKRRLSRLREMGRPDLVFIHCAEKNVEGVLGGWRSIGITPAGIMNAADLAVYQPGHLRPELLCDASICGARWPYKARNLDRYILPLLDLDLRIRIYGRGGWQGIPAYLGQLEDGREADLFASSSVCLNVSEPHSTDARYGSDIIERVFKVMACGGFLLSDHVDEMASVFGEGVVVTVKTPAEYEEKLRHYLKNPEERQAIAARGQSVVLSQHTYHHRAVEFFRYLGLDRFANDAAEKTRHLVSQLQRV
jgi:hypothetical protein